MRLNKTILKLKLGFFPVEKVSEKCLEKLLECKNETHNVIQFVLHTRWNACKIKGVI